MAGVALRRSFGPMPSVVRRADQWVINIALPSLIVSQMVAIDWDDRVMFPIATAWWVMSLSVVVVLTMARLRTWSHQFTGALLLVAVLGNTSFLGLGVVESVLGENSLPSAVAYDQPGTFLALATWGAFVATAYGRRDSDDGNLSTSTRLRSLVRRLFTFAPFVALLASVPLRWLTIPEPVFDIARMLGRTVAPVAMCAVGVRFVTSWSRRIAPVVLSGLALKMLLAPLFAVALTMVWKLNADVDAVAIHAAVTQASAPPMITAGIVAISAGCDEELVTSMLGWGTLCGFIWMPFVATAVSHLW